FETILDLDCGTGLLLEQLFEKCPNIKAYAFDYSLDRLKKARKRLAGTNTEFEFGQAINLPYLDNSFDIVVSTTSFHHYKQPEKVMSEVRRVLKSGGLFVICDTYLNSTLRYLNLMARPLNEVADMALYSKKQIWQMLNATGFTGVQWRLLNKYAYLVKATAAEMPLIEEF
ncbi:MAG: class I SAM-dependent methyltransferase, partial [Eubacteriaceae bacterium]